MHIGKEDGSVVVTGYSFDGGNTDELKVGKEIVREYVEAVGKGVIKILIMDRGYIDGEFIEELKEEYDIDVVIPFRKNMSAFLDSRRIAEAYKEGEWEEYNRYEKEGIKYREEVLYVGDVEDWESCGIKIYVSLMRTIGSDGSVRYWGLCTTFKPKDGKEAFEIYKNRSKIEELHKQIKEGWKINKFSSPNESLVEAHVLFTLLTYSLIQLYLSKKHLKELTNKTVSKLREEGRLGKESVIVYSGRYFAVLNLDYYTEIIADMEDKSKRRLLKWIKERRKRNGIRSP